MLVIDQPDCIWEFLRAKLTQTREVVLGADVDKDVLENDKMLRDLLLEGLVLDWVFNKLWVAYLPKGLIVLHALSVGGFIVFLPVFENTVHDVSFVRD